jgi:NAD-dependent SIR2 family protein deacetylase
MEEKILSAIRNAEAILVFAGAGMSADSNLPTYRDREGFWNDYPPYRELDKNYESMMSPHGFAIDPHFAWGFFAHQYRIYKNATPHEGYTKLSEMLQSKKDYFVVTTNVDGLFLKSGFPEDHLHEAHGTIHKLQCARTCQRISWRCEDLKVKVDYHTMKAIDPLPICPSCGTLARPNIFMYGDTDDSYVWEELQESAKRFREWREKNFHKKVVILEIGVGAEGLKQHIRQYREEFYDVTLIRINPEFDASYGDTILQMRVGARAAILALGGNI